jgi:peptide deformylase
MTMVLVYSGINYERGVMSNLKITRFGNPILRKAAKRLNSDEVKSGPIQTLIRDMKALLETDEYGVGLAAPQVGKSIALSVIGIKPTPTRPTVARFETIIINPDYVGIGEPTSKWEACISCGTGSDTLYAEVPRYEAIHASWIDEQGREHAEDIEGFVAHVFQHETDHLNGVLFVDRVKDSESYMMGDEYRKRVVNGLNSSEE